MPYFLVLAIKLMQKASEKFITMKIHFMCKSRFFSYYCNANRKAVLQASIQQQSAVQCGFYNSEEVNKAGVYGSMQKAGKIDKHEQTNPFGNHLSDFTNVEVFFENSK